MPGLRFRRAARMAADGPKVLAGTGDFALFLRRLDRIARAQERTLRDLDLLSQSFAMFVRLWLGFPAKRAPRRRPAPNLASSHFSRCVAERVASGQRFVDDLPQERVADDDELASIAQAAEADLGSHNAAFTPAPHANGGECPGESR